jgi:hypothetical protein
MLFVSCRVSKYSDFKELFKGEREIIDLSRVPSSQLVNECESITDHHSKAVVFLGYLEPGWMLDSTHQTRIRKLIRKFDVGFVCAFSESIPHSWKNEINTLYV